MKTKTPKLAVNQAPVVKETLSNVVDTVFGTEPIQCQLHSMDKETVVVMIGNGMCATLHLQEFNPNQMKGGLS